MEPKKRKVEDENRQFLPEWTDLYCFTLPNRAGAVPMCLICNQTVALIKSSNIKRHYDTKHKSFAGNFPLGSDLRKSKIASLLSSYSSSTQIISRSMTEQEKCGEASLRISWTLAKHMKPFTDADVVKECFLEAGNALFENKKDVVETIRRIPLSASTNTRNTHVLAEENHCDVKRQLNNANYYALAMDESCDVTDTAQLIIFVRYLDQTRETFVEEILTLLPLLRRTRGEDMIKVVMDYFEKDELDLKKLLSITTDGAPAMVGSKKGLVHLLSSNLSRCNENLISYHCIIHQTVLCCKLNHNFERIMQEVMKIVNFLCAKSSLQHRELKSFLEEVDAHYDDLLLHNNVRWLSKGAVLERFFSILEHLKTYLFNSDQISANAYLSFLNEKENVAAIAFLTDIFKHINDLNLKLQGKGKLVWELMSEVKSFSRKLELFINDLGNECLHFPNLNKIISNDNEIDVGQYKTFITNLKSEFKKRFVDFKKIENVVEILSSNIYSLHPDGKWSNEAAIVFGSDKATLQMEMIDFQENTVLKHKHAEVSREEFWIKFVCGNKYPELQKLALKLLTLFGSTYICEAAFSKMNFIKNKFRSRLTNEHLQDLMSIACTNFAPNFGQIIRNKKCHFSH